MYCDAHNHLHDEWLTPHRHAVLAELARVGVSHCVVNGTNEEDWDDVLELARTTRIVRPSLGLHPWEVGNRSPHWKTKLEALLDRNPTAVIGEIGLDRWMLDQVRPDDPRLKGLRRAPVEEQAEVFCWQFALAADRHVTPTVHCLNAFGLLYDILRSTPKTPRTFLLHAYSGPAEMVPLFVKFGAYFSFNGAFLDPRKQRLRDVYAVIPGNRLLVETDAPAMQLPVAHQRFALPNAEDDQPINHPANLIVAYEGLAAIRGTTVANLAQDVRQNFLRLFR